MGTAKREYKVDILIETADGVEIVEETIRTRSLLVVYLEQGKVKVYGSVHPGDIAVLGLALGPQFSLSLGELVSRFIGSKRTSTDG